jgi:hypothetical protein
MGGATTLVEARALGRHAVGTDISALSVFVAKAKTTLLTNQESMKVERRVAKARKLISPLLSAERQQRWMNGSYQKDLPWRIRKMIEQAIGSFDGLSSRERRFARCALLRASQSALDCRDQAPSAAEFRDALIENIQFMRLAMQELAASASKYRRAVTRTAKARASELPMLPIAALQKRQIRLVVTSPPYPGTHVLYHRWQIRGRRETAAPYWIADCKDGHGASYYTFGDRKRTEPYFEHLAQSFAGIRQVLADDAIVIQLVGFADEKTQLPKYLEVMEEAGFMRVQPRIESGSLSAWRTVPNRKWYAKHRSVVGNAREILLVHQPIAKRTRRKPASVAPTSQRLG